MHKSSSLVVLRPAMQPVLEDNKSSSWALQLNGRVCALHSQGPRFDSQHWKKIRNEKFFTLTLGYPRGSPMLLRLWPSWGQGSAEQRTRSSSPPWT